MASAGITEAEAREIIVEWGRLHDLQAGLSAFLPLIAREGFYLEFAGKRWEGYDGFERHQIEKRRFFDELHETVSIEMLPPAGDATHVRTLSHWDASYRPENSPRSRRIRSIIEHDWEFRRDPATGRPFMQGHRVTKFDYRPGFAPDDTPEYNPHLEAKRGQR